MKGLKRNYFNRSLINRRNNSTRKRLLLLLGLAALLAFIWILPIYSSISVKPTSAIIKDAVNEDVFEQQQAENEIVVTNTVTTKEKSSASKNIVTINSSVDKESQNDVGSNSTKVEEQNSIQTDSDIVLNNRVYGAYSISSTDVSAVSQHDVDKEDRFDFSDIGYNDYQSYASDHPIIAPLHYAGLWLLYCLEDLQPLGCSGCARQTSEEQIVDIEQEESEIKVVAQPDNGFIFESTGKRKEPQLTVSSPANRDVFVKLRDIETNETVLSFYVRANSSVKACVPAKKCILYYALGTEWLGQDEAFGDEGTYAVSDIDLNFIDSANKYTYTLETENGNVNPRSITRKEFF